MRRFAKLFVEAVLFLIIAIPFHEYSHATMVFLLGGQAVVRYDVRLGMTTILSKPSFPFWYVLSALAGGLFIGILYLSLSFIIHDIETSMSLRLVAAYQLSYAVVEGAGFTGILYIELVIVTVGLIIGLILSKPLLLKLFEINEKTV